jgi:hypothetical protein
MRWRSPDAKAPLTWECLGGLCLATGRLGRFDYPPSRRLFFANAKAEDTLRRTRHRWIKDAPIAIDVALIAIGGYELLTFLERFS